jgi:hypothetical protein
MGSPSIVYVFHQVPATGRTKRSLFFHSGIFLSIYQIGKADGLLMASRRLIAHPLHFPTRGIAVFEVGHKYIGAGVHGIDHHLAVNRPGDLYPASM